MVIPFLSSPYGYEMTPLRQRKSRVGAVFLVLMLIIALALPLPYVIFRPGTPENVLGKMISVPESYSALDLASRNQEGRLFLTTVFVTTPRSKVFGAEILKAWIRGDETVYPRDAIYPDGQDAKEIKSQEKFEMTSSQKYAIYNALTYLGFKVETEARVVEIVKESDAIGKIEIDDVIRKVDGKAVASSSEIVDLVRSKSPGDSISIEVERDGVTRVVPNVRLIQNSAGSAIGLFLVVDFDSPVDIAIEIKNTGGPSAGMIFALGIIEKMTGEDLLRGRKVAGSGTIDLQGRIGAIGGIENKLIGARRKGATLFLASINNCDEIAHIPDGLQVIPVATLKEAVEVLRDPDPSGRPSCQRSR
jgi:PDZ domain-containing protein